MTADPLPVWGNVADLIDLLDVHRVADGRYVSTTRPGGSRSVVEGSQILAQALVAGARHSPGRRMVSGHMVFCRVANTSSPLQVDLDEITAGATFTTIAVRVGQDARDVAVGTLLLDATAPDLIQHVASPPPCDGPEESAACDMGVIGRDIRVVDAAYTDDPDAPIGAPVIDAWVRLHDVPADPALHAALLAQFTGHMPIAAALRPHRGIGQTQAHRTVSMGINAIALSLHADVHADGWMRYHHESTYAGAGMTHAECRVYTESGSLIASFTVDAMVRGFRDDRVHDERSAI